jgi:hypothetical protein
MKASKQNQNVFRQFARSHVMNPVVNQRTVFRFRKDRKSIGIFIRKTDRECRNSTLSVIAMPGFGSGSALVCGSEARRRSGPVLLPEACRSSRYPPCPAGRRACSPVPDTPSSAQRRRWDTARYTPPTISSQNVAEFMDPLRES